MTPPTRRVRHESVCIYRSDGSRVKADIRQPSQGFEPGLPWIFTILVLTTAELF